MSNIPDFFAGFQPNQTAVFQVQNTGSLELELSACHVQIVPSAKANQISVEIDAAGVHQGLSIIQDNDRILKNENGRVIIKHPNDLTNGTPDMSQISRILVRMPENSDIFANLGAGSIVSKVHHKAAEISLLFGAQGEITANRLNEAALTEGSELWVTTTLNRNMSVKASGESKAHISGEFLHATIEMSEQARVEVNAQVNGNYVIDAQDKSVLIHTGNVKEGKIYPTRAPSAVITVNGKAFG